MGGEYHFWVTSGDLRTEITVTSIANLWLLKATEGNRSNAGLYRCSKRDLCGPILAFPLDKGLLLRWSRSAFWGRGRRQKERADVTEKRGLEGGAEMVSGDIEDTLSVLYLSY